MNYKLAKIVYACVLGMGSVASAQSWSAAMLLNEPGESPQGAVKKPEVCRAAVGGFHIVYRHHLSWGTPMKYRRWLGGNKGPVIVAAAPPHYNWDQYVCEAANGDIHITWENWDSTPNIGWTKSSNGGASFQPYIELTNFPSSAKAPRIAPYGWMGSDVLLVVANPADKYMWYNRYNGTSWVGAASTGIGYESEWQLFGIARSPVDGSVYAPHGPNKAAVSLMKYDGTWSSSNLESPGFYARQAVAVNQAGQIMVCYEKDSTWYSKLYTPGAGWAATQTIRSGAGFGSVIAIQGTTEFYTVYSQGSTPLRIRGKRWSSGSWGAEEVISNLPDAQALDARVAIATDGTMLCCWEYWGSGNAEAWYSVRSATSNGATGTLAGTVRDQYGVGIPGASITTVMAAATSAPNGAYSTSSPTGTYTVTASKPYYAGQAVDNVSVLQNQTTTVNFVLTGQPPTSVTGFAAAASSTVNMLQWTNPGSAQFSATRIVYRTDRAPTGPNDGTVLIDDAALPGTTRTIAHTGLTNGVTYYYGAYGYFQDVSRFYAAGVHASGAPAVRPDMDHDGDVDQADFGLFQGCYSGAYNPQSAPECQQAKLDGDTDVDQDDATVFIRCMSGANVYASTTCAD